MKQHDNDSSAKTTTFGPAVLLSTLAVGAAVGFWNVWRFRSSVEYGGGALFIPYFLASYHRCPYSGPRDRFRPVLTETGVFVLQPASEELVSPVSRGWMLVVYYSVLIAWVINAFFDAFGDEVHGPMKA
jgi:SNF family Na+-dependent transporter